MRYSIVLVLLLAGCVSDEEHAEVVRRNESKQLRITELTGRIGELEGKLLALQLATPETVIMPDANGVLKWTELKVEHAKDMAQQAERYEARIEQLRRDVRASDEGIIRLRDQSVIPELKPVQERLLLEGKSIYNLEQAVKELQQRLSKIKISKTRGSCRCIEE